MRSHVRELEAFSASLSQEQYRPQAKFIAAGIYALLVAGSPVLTEMAAALLRARRYGLAQRLDRPSRRRREPTGFDQATVNYLSRNLGAERLEDGALWRAHLEIAGELVQGSKERVVVAVDGTTIPKDYAVIRAGRSHMEYARRVWDNCRKMTVSGYRAWVVEAFLPGRIPVPLLLEPYSEDEPGYVSNYATLLERLKVIARHVPDDAIWVFDREFITKALVAGFDEIGIRWVVRAKARGNQTVFDARGDVKRLGDVALSAGSRAKLTLRNKRGQKRKARMGWQKVTLRDGGRRLGPERTLVTVYNWYREPRVLLCSATGYSKKDVVARVEAYERRWWIEESIRHSKERTRRFGFALKDVRVLKFGRLKRLLVLMNAARLFFAVLRRRHPEATAAVLARSLASGTKPHDLSYRFCDGLRQLLSHVPAWRVWRLLTMA